MDNPPFIDDFSIFFPFTWPVWLGISPMDFFMFEIWIRRIRRLIVWWLCKLWLLSWPSRMVKTSHTWRHWNHSWESTLAFTSLPWMWPTIRRSSSGFASRHSISALKITGLEFLGPARPIVSGVVHLLRQGIGVLVIGGCTTTSCVRVSSTRIAGQLEEQGLSMKVVVDLNLCGARQENFEHTAHYDPVLVGIYGREFCAGKSAVDLAIVQMKRAGVEVVASAGWDWWVFTW